MNKTIGVSIILPTYNEEECIDPLVSSLIPVLDISCKGDYEIIVVDDSSEDKTREVVKNLSSENGNLKLVERNEERSLPLSLFEGIQSANKEYVMWLDSDGSMDAESVGKLLNELKEKNNDVIIGSRFVKGGGYKGKDKIKNLNIKNFVKTIIRSEDSLIAIILSNIFNKLLNAILPIKVKDLTSGFIVGKKSYFNKSMFENSVYGEYFINVVVLLSLSKISIKEVGYYCKARQSGESKTSTNILRLVSLSKPYINAALKNRKKF